MQHPDMITTPKWERLSRRETEVLRLMALECLEDKRIARVMGISSRTVEAHKYRAMEKVGAHNRLELVKWVVTAHVEARYVGA